MAKGVTLADVDRDGALDVVAASGEGFVILGANGKPKLDTPRVLKEPTDRAQNNFNNAPTVCDVDGDGRLDVVLAGTNRSLYAVRGDGGPLSGFPVALDGEPKGAVSCVSVPDSKAHDLVLVTDAGTLARVSYRGGPARRIASVGKSAESGVGVSDLNGDGKMDYVVVGGDSRLYVIDSSGRIDPQVSYRMEFRVSGTPSIGDIDDDGKPEIVLASQDFKVHAVGLDGESLDGFPYATEYRLYGSAALADIDRDGVLDVVVGSGDRRVHVINGAGKALPGFPSKVDGRVSAEVAVGDVDFDGRPEIAVVTERGSLFLFDSKGKVVRGFPTRLAGEKAVTAPALGDIDGDGAPELVAQAEAGEFLAFRFAKRGKAERAVVDWGMTGHDSGGTGRYGPNPGRYKDLGFSQDGFTTTEAVTARYIFFDLDGDEERGSKIRWFRNGSRVKEIDDSPSVPNRITKKGERWHYTIQAAENFSAFGENGTLARVFKSPKIKILNTPPTVPTVVLGPEDLKTTDAMTVNVSRASDDVDGDRVVYRYSWLKNGDPETRYEGKNRVDARSTRKGEVWRVVVTPFDGESEGESANALVTVKNTVPSAPKVAFNLKAPRVDQPIQVLVKTPSVDPDGDKVTYRYQYSVGGEILAMPVSSPTVPPRTLRKHQTLQVVVTAWDDEAAGGNASIGLKVANTPPKPPKHAITPAAPKTTDPLSVGVRTQPADADRDPVVLDYQWLLDGKPVQQPMIVPPEATRKGQTWTVRVTPRDGEDAGRTVEAKTVIQNTPPVAPLMVLARYRYDTASTIEPQVQKEAVDADGDRVSLRYDWLRNGVSSGVKSSTLPSSATAKDQRWELVVTPNDGTTDGVTTRLGFVIENSPPTAPRVRFNTSTPSVRDRVRVEVSEPAQDRDGDKLEYRYRWYRNGRAVSQWPVSKMELKPGDAKKGEQLRVEVVAYDGANEGPKAIAELRVRNHVPDPPVVRVVREKGQPRKLAARGSAPKAAPLTTVDDLRCAITKASVDPDRDPVTYRYRWYRSGALVPTAADLDVLPSSMTTQDERWECEAIGSDGEGLSRVARAEAVVLANSAPGTAVVNLFPKEATTGDDLVCELAEFAVDADYDTLNYAYRWRMNGRPQEIEGNRVAAARTARGQRWQCEVVASDGKLSGAASAAETTIRNTPPRAPVVNLRTPSFAGEELRCEIQEPSTDADRDRLSYRYRWTKDGVLQSFAGESQTVPGRLVKKGDQWKCEVIASDGAVNIAPSSSPSVTVQTARKPKAEPESRAQKRRRRGRRRR